MIRWILVAVGAAAGLIVVVVVGILVVVNIAALRAPSGSGEKDPDWSPDGGQLAYTRYNVDEDACTSSIWVGGIDRDSPDQKLSDGGEHPDWSPDGKRIAFGWVEYLGSGIRRNGIAVMNADGSNVRRLISRERRVVDLEYPCVNELVNDPAWSPDGSLIAFSDPFVGGIFVMRPDGTNQRQVTKRDDMFPSWSPDGKQLVFLNGHEITIGSADGKRRRGLGTVDTGDAPRRQGSRPAWSPDGAEIAYVGLSLIPPAGGDSLPVTGGECFSPSWSPDANRIACASGNPGIDGEQRIKIVEVPKR